ncbi:uncharacterized protein LOC123301050 [Chrysoperla carnea]|uniref:uncharacterized protein LOC123301050 n=1 Tax=Chrysoperla carnea TaxID=189513 RepID=UPI001D097B15|nr:uncharacterized protein LOC123301050 [Chrysoperla carnea]
MKKKGSVTGGSQNRDKSASTISKRSALANSGKEITPVSYIRVKFFPYSEETSHQSPSSPKMERELFININCPIRLLMEYLRLEANIPMTLEFDLFDEMGTLKRTFQLSPEKMASQLLVSKAIYFIVVFPKNDLGVSLKPLILINRGSRLNTDYTARIRRQIQASARKYIKSSRASD